MKNLKLYDPFLWMGLNCLKATWPLQGDSLLFTTQPPGVPDTHLINFDRIKEWNKLDPPSRFESGILDWEYSVLITRTIGKAYLKCKCPVFINIKQTLHYKVAIE